MDLRVGASGVRGPGDMSLHAYRLVKPEGPGSWTAPLNGGWMLDTGSCSRLP